jgi:hypothetical protein
MYEVISYENKSKWDERISELTEKDVFYDHSYANVYQKMGDGDPYLFFYQNQKGKKLCYAFLKRRINDLPFLKEFVGEDLYDIVTPSYGYGGPLYDKEEADLIRESRKAFEEYCKSENIITEFIRFHPLLQNQKHLEGLIEVSYDRETVFIDLGKSEDEILQHFHKNHKRNIIKANKNGLTFKVFQKEEMLGLINEFYELYTKTMDKLNASKYSYFSTEYLHDLASGFFESSMIGAVFKKEKMVAAAFCMYDGTALHYHLGCSEKEYLNLGSSIFLLHQVALWGKARGLLKFHLGGGHVGRDSLFQFKHRFNVIGELDFYIGRKVHHPEAYQNLREKWEQYYSQEANDQYFPCYRYSVDKKVSTVLVEG